MTDLPGQEEANKLGYTIHYTNGDKTMASYLSDDGIHLDIFDNKGTLTAELTFVSGVLIVKTTRFSFPHKRFDYFESQILKAREVLPR